jgi:TonB-dependent receptor
LVLSLGINSARAQEKPADKPADQAATKPADQTTAKEPVITMDKFVVTGLRASLMTAQDFKANASEFVDSVVAQDIGKFPDNTVADALQHVTGVQVSRSASEANTPVIRGLPNLITTLNGYEVYTGTSRGVALQDIPAEMLAGVEVYKSVGPDKIEGGVAGLIDVRLRRPFDFGEGLTYSANVRGLYGTQSKLWSYVASGLVSNRWKTDLGEFGVLVDVSYARRRYQDQIVDNYVHFGADYDYTARDASYNPTLTSNGYYSDNYGWQLKPGDRKRPAVSLAMQWKTKSGIELYSDTLFTGYRNPNSNHFLVIIPSWGGYRNNVVLYPSGYGGYNVDDPLVAGTQTARWVQSFVAHDTVTLSSTQAFDATTDTYQGALGGKWDNGTVKVDGEFSYNISTVKTKGIILDTGIISPSLAFTYNDGDVSTVQASGIDYASASNYFLTQFYDQWSRAYSGQYAVKSDALVRLDHSFVKSLQFGVRYSDRLVHFHQANPGGTFIWNAASATASSLSGMGSLTSTEPFVSASQLNIRTYWTPDATWLLDNPDKLRPIFGRATGSPLADPGSTITDSEKNFAAYALANYKFDLGGTPLDGVIGVRFVDSHTSIGGYQHTILADGSTSSTLWQPSSNEKTHWELLPTLNGRLSLTDKLFARYSVTKTETRPDFASLNPALSLTQATMTVPGSGSGGNPNLDPVKSTNYDVSLEYYPSKANLATAAVFYRKLDGYIQSYSSMEQIGANSYNVTRPRNTEGGYLEGFETAYTYFFDFLPDQFKGLGLQANYTYLKGETKDPLTGITADIAQVSKNNYNLILIYEQGALSSRLAYNWRGKYIDSYTQPGIQPTTVWVMPTKTLDFSVNYAVTKNLTVTFDATNILKSKYKDNFGNMPMFSRDVRSYDSTYEVGLRYRF